MYTSININKLVIIQKGVGGDTSLCMNFAFERNKILKLAHNMH